jgi:hypothetical protein
MPPSSHNSRSASSVAATPKCSTPMPYAWICLLNCCQLNPIRTAKHAYRATTRKHRIFRLFRRLSPWVRQNVNPNHSEDKCWAMNSSGVIGLRPVAGRLQHGKMTVFCDHEISFSRNRAVAELVVIWVCHDDAEVVMGCDLPDGPVNLGQQFQKGHHISQRSRPESLTMTSSYSSMISVETARMNLPSSKPRTMR